MSFSLNEADWIELCGQAPQPQIDNLVLDDFEELWGMPEHLAQGYNRCMELSPGVNLEFSDRRYRRDLVLQTSEIHPNPFWMTVILTGSLCCELHPNLNETQSLFSGSGLAPGCKDEFQSGQHLVYVSVTIDPEVVKSYFLSDEQCSFLQKQLSKDEDWEVSFYPKVTPGMRSLAYQMWNAPYRGAVKRMYLQAKVFELLALNLDLISEDPQQTKSSPKLKPKTVASLHHAKDILTTQFENPPSLPQLAEQVGMSQRTLQRGFSSFFNITITGYLTQQRLDRAEMLLREGKYSVAEVATKVGYGNMGHFSVAFRGRFGITPSQCLAGKMAEIEQKNDRF